MYQYRYPRVSAVPVPMCYYCMMNNNLENYSPDINAEMADESMFMRGHDHKGKQKCEKENKHEKDCKHEKEYKYENENNYENEFKHGNENKHEKECKHDHKHYENYDHHEHNDHHEHPMYSQGYMDPVVMKKTNGSFNLEEARKIGELLGVDWSRSPFNVEQFRQGMNVELEHGRRDPATDVTGDDPILTGKIALAHLKEFPDYYVRLKKLESEAASYWKNKKIMR